MEKGIKQEKFNEIEKARGELRAQLMSHDSFDVTSSPSYKHCQIIFYNKVKDMITRLNFRIRKLSGAKWKEAIPEHEIGNLSKAFGQLDIAQSSATVFVTRKQNKELMDLRGKTKVLLEHWIDRLVVQLCQSIECHEFKEAELRIDDIECIWAIVGSFVSNKYKEKMDGQLEREILENKISDHCSQLITKYKDLKFNKRGYLNKKYSLKLLDEKLKPVLINSRCCLLLSNETWNDFQEKFQQALQAAQDANTKEEEKRLLSLCRNVIEFAPNDKHEELKEELENCEEDIKHKDDEFTKMFTQFKSSNNYSELANMWRKMKRDGKTRESNRIERFITKRLSQNVEQMEAYLRESNINSNMNKIITCHQNMMHIVKNFNLKKADDKIEATSEFLNEILNMVENAESQMSQSFVSLAKMKQVRSSGKQMIQVLINLDELSSKLWIDKHRRSMKQEINQLGRVLTDHLDSLEINLTTMMDSGKVNFSRVGSILMEFKLYVDNELFNLIGTDEYKVNPSENKENEPVSAYSDNINNNYNERRYEDIVNKVKNVLSDTCGNILKQELTTKNKRNSRDREKVIESIKADLNDLVNCFVNYNQSICETYLKINIFEKYKTNFSII